MSEDINLSVFDRITIINTLNAGFNKNGGSLLELNAVLKVLDKINFTDEENESLNFRTETNALGGVQVKWNQESDNEKGFDFTCKEFDIIKKYLEDKKDWVVDVRSINLAEKFIDIDSLTT